MSRLYKVFRVTNGHRVSHADSVTRCDMNEKRKILLLFVSRRLHNFNLNDSLKYTDIIKNKLKQIFLKSII